MSFEFRFYAALFFYHFYFPKACEKSLFKLTETAKCSL